MEKSTLGDKLKRVFGAREEEKIKDYSETRDKAIKDKDKDEKNRDEDIACGKDTKSKDEEKE